MKLWILEQFYLYQYFRNLQYLLFGTSRYAQFPLKQNLSREFREVLEAENAMEFSKIFVKISIFLDKLKTRSFGQIAL